MKNPTKKLTIEIELTNEELKALYEDDEFKASYNIPQEKEEENTAILSELIMKAHEYKNNYLKIANELKQIGIQL